MKTKSKREIKQLEDEKAALSAELQNSLLEVNLKNSLLGNGGCDPWEFLAKWDPEVQHHLLVSSEQNKGHPARQEGHLGVKGDGA